MVDPDENEAILAVGYAPTVALNPRVAELPPGVTFMLLLKLLTWLKSVLFVLRNVI